MKALHWLTQGVVWVAGLSAAAALVQGAFTVTLCLLVAVEVALWCENAIKARD